ncbi:signal peptide peptidase SppA [Candidatus Poribacteria bacterium]|nr:signal peptide peptidase SppA [Candidatus Poribacteria bacterium]
MEMIKNRFILTFTVALLTTLLTAFAQDTEKPPTNQFVEISISGALSEVKPTFALGTVPTTPLNNILKSIDKIEENKRIIGVIIRIGGIDTGWGKLQEIRNRLINLHQNGKMVISYLDSANNAEYLLATATEQIILAPAGTIGLTGLRAEVIFYKGILDKFDIKADLFAIGDYKSAIEPYTRKNMSEAQRQAMTSILDNLHQQQVDMIAAGREHINAERAIELINQGPFTANEAHEVGLVDSLSYYDQLITSLESNHDSKTEFIPNYGKKAVTQPDLGTFTGLMKFISMFTKPTTQSKKHNTPKIALIYATGPIMPNHPQIPFGIGAGITPHRIIDALQTARKDESVRAIVIRVDSPGGSALASDLIWHEVKQAQEQKPTIVSMSDVAASGGYYISAAATEIVAQPGTITGSIGVLGGKLNLKGIYNKVGLTKDIITRGKNADIYSDYSNFSQSERQKIEKMLHKVYDDFVNKVAEGRQKTYDEIHQIAQGRVWTGQQAKELGLIDWLGGLDTALAIAKKHVSISHDEPIEIITLPKPKPLLEILMEDFEANLQVPLNRHISVPYSLAKSIPNFHLIQLLAHEPMATIIPFDIEIR